MLLPPDVCLSLCPSVHPGVALQHLGTGNWLLSQRVSSSSEGSTHSPAPDISWEMISLLLAVLALPPVHGGMSSAMQGLVLVPLSTVSTQKSHTKLSCVCPEPGQGLHLVIFVSPFHIRTFCDWFPAQSGSHGLINSPCPVTTSCPCCSHHTPFPQVKLPCAVYCSSIEPLCLRKYLCSSCMF